MENVFAILDILALVVTENHVKEIAMEMEYASVELALVKLDLLVYLAM